MNLLLAEASPSIPLPLWTVNLLIAATVAAGLSLAVAHCVSRRATLAHGILLGGLWLVLLSPLTAILLHAQGWHLIRWPAPRATGQPLAETREWPLLRIEETAPDRTSTGSLRTDGRTAARPARPAAAPRPAVAEASLAARLRSVVASILPWLATGLPGIWLIGVTVLAIRFLRGWFSLQRLLRSSRPVTAAGPRAVFGSLIRETGWAAEPRFHTADNLSGPIATGWLRPCVLLPEGLPEQLDAEQLRAVLLHELAHLARRDTVELMLQQTAAILFWFHPLVSLLNRRLARTREEICDNHVLRRVSSTGFSRALLRIAQLTSPQAGLPCSMSLLNSGWTLESRVSGILDPRRSTMTRCSLFDSVCIATAVLLTGVAGILGTVGPAAAATAAVAPATPLQRDDDQPCELAFLARPAAILESRFVELISPNITNGEDPVNDLFLHSTSVRGVVALPEDYATLENPPDRQIPFRFYIEFTLKSGARPELYMKMLEKEGRKLREEGKTVFYRIPDSPPEAGLPGFQIIVDENRITIASEEYRYDPANLPAMTGTVGKQLKEHADEEALIIVDLRAANRFVESIAKRGRESLPPLAAPYLQALGQIEWASASLEIDDSLDCDLRMECGSAEQAAEMARMARELVTMAKTMNQSAGPNGEMIDRILGTFETRSSGSQVTADFRIDRNTADLAKESQQEMQVMNTFKQVALGMHNFDSAFGGRLPFQPAEGESPEISWRVRLLPFFAQQELASKFDLTQPWNSPHNLQVLEANPMPEFFRDQSAGGSPQVLGVPLAGEGGTDKQTNICWVRSDITSFQDVTNGMSNTIAFVRGDKFVNWTENNDLTPAEVMLQFRSLGPDEHLIATFYDGSVRKIPASTPPEEVEAMLNPRRPDR